MTITNFAGGKTGIVTLEGDFDLTYTFTNKSNGTDNWDNYVIEMVNGSEVYLDIRADNYGWTNNASGYTLTFGSGASSWSSWLAQMQEGQKVTVLIERRGGNVIVTATAAGETFTATAYVDDYADGGALTVYLTGEECELTNVSYHYVHYVTVTKVNLKKCEISLSEYDYVYDGTEKTPEVTVSYNGTVLTEGEDYTVSYVDNVEPGTATVTVTATGNWYSGSVSLNFTISPEETESGEEDGSGEETGTGEGIESGEESGTGEGTESGEELETGEETGNNEETGGAEETETDGNGNAENGDESKNGSKAAGGSETGDGTDSGKLQDAEDGDGTSSLSTGDCDTWIWVVLLLISCGCIAGILFSPKRENSF